MKFFLIFLVSCFLICFSCNDEQAEFKAPMAKLPGLPKNEKIATFSEGCFWHSELIFESLVGVNHVISGYSGGTVENPFYEYVSTGETGHAESVQIYYDSTLVSYRELVRAFFRNGYEGRILQQLVDSIQTTLPQKIVTELIPFNKFYPTEEFHQDYARKYPENDYVAYICAPAFTDFRFKYKGNFKIDSVNTTLEIAH